MPHSIIKSKWARFFELGFRSSAILANGPGLEYVGPCMEAIILCGGKGTRLRPLTNLLPKPLLPVGNIPILDLILRQLRASEVHTVTLAVGPFRRQIEAFAGNGESWGLTLNYCEEGEPLGTAGALTLLTRLPENFLVLNGDILCQIEFSEFFRAHEKSGAEISIATYERPFQVELGVLDIDADGRVSDYLEKPEWRYPVSAGIYAVSRSALAHLPPGTAIDFPELVQRLLRQKRLVRAHRLMGLWLDIGRPEDFERAHREILHHPTRFLPSSARIPSAQSRSQG